MDSFNNYFRKKSDKIPEALKKFSSAWRSAKSSDIAKMQTDLDRKLVYSLSKSRIPSLTQLKYIKKFLTKRELWTLRVSLTVLMASLAFLGARFVITHLQIAPADGGDYVEGLIGTPQHITPLYSSVNDVDGDISWLVYSSLFKRDKSGALAKDLVESYEASADNKAYTIILREGVKWHDETPLTADDVVFTLNAIKDQHYKSPLRPSFTGVEIEKVDDRTFVLKLQDPYAAFLDLLTFGIMPASLWSQIPAESAQLAGLNLKPIGSGPYKYDKLVKDEKTGRVKEYSLIANKDFYGRKPYINIKFKFYPNFEEMIAALNSGQIDGMSYLPQDYKKEVTAPTIYSTHNMSLPQITAIFFNQKTNPALADKKVRQALAVGLNREFIVQKVLEGNGIVADSAILPNSFAYFADVKKYDYDPANAAKMLEEAGWKKFSFTSAEIEAATKDAASEDEEARIKAEKVILLGEGEWRKKGEEYLIIKITTVDRSENGKVLEDIKNYWEALGVKTEIEVVPSAKISSDIVKPRNFEALFYGLVLGVDPDVYVFWHSSQAESGYNIANFKNKEIDQLLEEARLISDQKIRQEKYKRVQEIIAEELPAIFMYSPNYAYIQTKAVKGFAVTNILVPHDRFANVSDWYINTSKKVVW